MFNQPELSPGGNATIDINGSFTLSGGSFTATSGTMTVTGSFTTSGSPTFNANGGRIEFDGSSTSNTSINAPGIDFNLVTINRSLAGLGASPVLTIAENTTIPLGDSPTLTLINIHSGKYSLTNNGTITVGSGMLTTQVDGTLTNNGIISAASITNWDCNCNLVNNGTITMTSNTSFDFNAYGNAIGSLTNNSGATFSTGANPTFNIVGDFDIDSASTFPSPITIIFDWEQTYFDGHYLADTTVDAPSITFTSATINRSLGALGNSYNFTIASGTTIPLGDSPTLTLINTQSGTYSMVNNGIITVGTGTFTEAVEGTFTNNGTITTKTVTLSGSITQASGSTVQFIGDGDSAADVFTLTNFGSSYHHLIINATDGVNDSFSFGLTPTLGGDLTVTAGILVILTVRIRLLQELLVSPVVQP